MFRNLVVLPTQYSACSCYCNKQARCTVLATMYNMYYRGVDNFLEVGGLNILTCKWPRLLYDTSCAQDASLLNTTLTIGLLMKP